MEEGVTRRDALRLIVAGAASTLVECTPAGRKPAEAAAPTSAGGAADPIIETIALGFPWQTFDPFLFCVHHDDKYPAGDERMGPVASLSGRNLGNDFVVRDGFRMYHGRVVPGFPQHPHRGFETVTVVRRGLLDHSDSMGATARYGRGDVQWLTAGGGIQHAEMFPLVEKSGPNPVELFQIWLNLPSVDKMADPHFAMLWDDTIPRHAVLDASGRSTQLAIVAGRFGDKRAPAPPPKSWAARPDSDVAIWTIKMAPRATFTLPAAKRGTNRTLYLFDGAGLRIVSRAVTSDTGVRLRADVDVALEAGPGGAEMLMLQGRPIGEPVVNHGPFVMNTREEIQQTILDYQRTRFGGWPWASDDPVHAREQGRFARRPDGKIERPG